MAGRGLAALALLAPAAASAAPGAIKAVRRRRASARCSWTRRRANPLDNSVDDHPGREGDVQLPDAGTSVHNVAFNARRPAADDCVQLTGVVVDPDGAADRRRRHVPAPLGRRVHVHQPPAPTASSARSTRS